MRPIRVLLLAVFALVATVFAAGAATHAGGIAFPTVVAPPVATPTPIAPTGHRIPLPGRTPTAASTASSDGIPHPPPPPRGTSRIRRIRAATGADITVTFGGGCTSTYPSVIPVGCAITWQPINVPAGSHDCYYLPNAVSAVSASGASQCKNGASGGSYPLTLSIAGTYILGSLNKGTGVWDELIYLTVGTAPTLQTYSNGGLSQTQSTFVPNGSNVVYLAASGLTDSTHYVIDISQTGQNGACVFESGSGITTNFNLCDPSVNSAPTLPSGGQIIVSWTPPNGQQNGTYTAEVFDHDGGIRVATKQFALANASGGPTTTFVPSSTYASPAPAFTVPPFTDLGTFAYDGNDASVSSVTIKTTGAAASKTYTRTITDPNGVLVNSVAQSATSDATGKIPDTAFTFAVPQTPSNYTANTYTYSLYDAGTALTTFSKSFQMVGYAMQSEFSAPFGTALTIPGGSATSNMQFFNSADTLYGRGLGDAIQYIEVKTANDGTVLSLNCGVLCTTESVSDSAGNTWSATITNALGVYRLFLSPQNNALPSGATLTVPNMLFTNTSGCGSAGCKLTISFVPQHGVAWTDPTKNAANPVYLVYIPGTTLAATGTIALVGNEGHNYASRSTQAIYAYGEPFAQTAKPKFKYAIINTSSGGSAAAITGFRLTMPSGFVASSASVFDGGASGWAIDAAGCSGLGANVVCFKKTTGAGIAIGGGADYVTFYINSPNTAFSYTDVLGEVTAPSNFNIIAATPQATVPVGSSNPQLVDSTTIAAYSLNSAYMGFSLSPPSISATTAVSFSYTNTSTAQDPFPDYIDALVVDIPTGQGSLSGISTSRLALFPWNGPVNPTTNNLGANVDRYWFGVCAAQRASGQPQFASIPAATCTSANEQNSIAPGGNIVLSATYTPASAGNTFVIWAHGANSGGWTGVTYAVTGSATANGGFESIGLYGAPVTLTTGAQPTVGLDTNATYGNSFSYRMYNTGAKPILYFRIRLPATDTTGANAADTESTPVTWTVTNTPTLTSNDTPSTNDYGCTVNNTTNPTTGGVDGQIYVTGCSIPTNGYVDVSFAMKAPYDPNRTFKFIPEYSVKFACPALPGSCALTADPQWTNDTTMLVPIAANILITVNPTAFNGTNPTVSCAGCTFGAGLIDFGTIASDNATHTYGDVVRIDITTTASGAPGWNVYESVATNPTNVSGAPTNELQTRIDGAVSNPVSGGAVTYTTVATVVPTAGNGATMATTTGANAQRNPFSLIDSFLLNVASGDVLGARTPAVTYTFIAN